MGNTFALNTYEEQVIVEPLEKPIEQKVIIENKIATLDDEQEFTSAVQEMPRSDAVPLPILQCTDLFESTVHEMDAESEVIVETVDVVNVDVIPVVVSSAAYVETDDVFSVKMKDVFAVKTNDVITVESTDVVTVEPVSVSGAKTEEIEYVALIDQHELDTTWDVKPVLWNLRSIPEWAVRDYLDSKK